MRAAGDFRHGGGGGALPEHQPRLRRVFEVICIHQFIAGDERGIGGADEEVVHIMIRAGDLAHAARIRPVDMNEGGIQFQGRHRCPLPVVVGAVDDFEFGVARDDVRAEAHPGGDEREAPSGGAQAEQHHAFVQFHHFDGAFLPGFSEVRLQGDEVQRDEGEDEFFHFAGGAQHADIGAAVSDHRQVPQGRAQDFPHQGHGLAARAPAADAEGHAVSQLGDDGGGGHQFIHGLILLRSSVFRTLPEAFTGSASRKCTARGTL